MNTQHQIIEQLNEAKANKTVKKVKKSFDRVKYREDWKEEKDIETLSKKEFTVNTKYLSIDSGLLGKKDADIEGLAVDEVTEYLKKKRNRSIEEIEKILYRKLHERFLVFEISDMRILLRSKKNKRRMIEIRYHKKLRKKIDAVTNKVKKEPEKASFQPISKDEIQKRANVYREEDRKKIDEGITKVISDLSNNSSPIKKEKISIQSIMKEGGCNKEVAEKAGNIANQIFEKSYNLEPQITGDVVGAVQMLGGSMYGLSHRLKQGTSLGRKIASDAVYFGGSLAKAAEDVKDSIRYTAVFAINRFVNGYKNVKQQLESKGYVELRCKNFYIKYAKGQSQQKAVQCVYESPDGVMFELQFHTPESQGAKTVNHPLYEKFRSNGTANDEKSVCDMRMVNISSNVPDPEGVLDIEEHG